MSLAIASKQQLKAWKLASREDNGRVIENVLLEIKKSKVGYRAVLIATDGYQIVHREIDPEKSAKETRINIPRKALQAAEKSMGNNDRAYFDDGKITIRAAMPDNPVVDYDSPVKAIIPFIEQTSMNFPETKTLLERSADSMFPEKSLTINPRLLREMLDQFKDNNGNVTSVKLHIAGASEVLILKSNDTYDGNDIIGGVMPLKA